MRTHTVSPAVANFGATRIGDMVSIAFEDRLTFVLSDRKTPTPPNRDVSVVGAASAGQNLTGVSASQAVGTWWVVGVNPAANTITLVNPTSGPVRTYNVTTQAGRDQLSRVKVGDSLTAINSQAPGRVDYAKGVAATAISQRRTEDDCRHGSPSLRSG